MTYPTITPKLTLDFANSRQLDPRITFSRSSTATRLNPDVGLITTAPSGVARFEKEGFLIEEARTNLIQRSIDYTTYWNKYNVTIDPNVETAPDGTTTASKMQWSSSSNRNMVFVQPTTDVTQTHTCSFYAKADEWNYAAVAMQPPGGGQPRYYITVDLTTGAIEEYTSGSPTQTSAVATPLPNGWWRVSATANVNSAGKTQVQMEVGMSPNNTFGGSVSGTPDGTSGIYIWGAQEEQGSFLTSYIPTSGSTVTRAADVVEATLPNVLNGSEGVFVTYATVQNPSINNHYIVHSEDATNTGDAVLLLASANYSLNIYDNNTETVRINYLAYQTGVKTVAAHAYATDNTSYITDGVVRGTDTSCSMPSALNKLYIFANSNRPAYSLVTGHFHRLVYYDRRVSDATLETLTS